MLLRDDRQVALNRVESLCLECADGYASAAARCEDDVLSALFDDAQRERAGLAAALAPHIRALGDLPSEPDPDREALGQVIDGLRAYLSADGDAQLLERRLKDDAQLEEAAREAQGAGVPEETQQVLQQVIGEVAQTRSRLLELQR